jgi:hypothetical protein
VWRGLNGDGDCLQEPKEKQKETKLQIEESFTPAGD